MRVLLISLLLAIASAMCVANDGFNLSPLSSSKSDYVVRSTDGTYTFTFNICVGIQTPCNFYSQTAVCQSYGLNVQVICGKNDDQTITYNASTNSYEFHYGNGDNGRSSIISVACNPQQNGGNFGWTVENTSGSLVYTIKGSSSLACNPAHTITPPPSSIPTSAPNTGTYAFHARTDGDEIQSWYLAKGTQLIVEQFNPIGAYTLSEIGDLVEKFEALIASGLYTWFTTSDLKRLIIPLANGNTTAIPDDGAVAVSSYPVPNAYFQEFASSIPSATYLASQNGISLDGSVSPSPVPTKNKFKKFFSSPLGYAIMGGSVVLGAVILIALVKVLVRKPRAIPDGYASLNE